ncbi:integrase repeat-containing protein [Candidatus Omnitrophota bacterium]
MKKTRHLYKTLSEAKKGVKKLKITTLAEFRKKIAGHRRIPYHPDLVYKKKGWVDWYNFFGKKRRNLYKSYKEAERAARKLGAQSRPQYKRLFIRNSRLPSHPDESYRNKGWKGWKAFLGKKKR